jgi:hypothetical protein
LPPSKSTIRMKENETNSDGPKQVIIRHVHAALRRPLSNDLADLHPIYLASHFGESSGWFVC